MNIQTCTLEPFAVIGLVRENNGLYDTNTALWQELNRRGQALQELAKRDEDGDIMGAWGLLNNQTHNFRLTTKPGTKIFYMAGLEVEDEAAAPAGFTKWIAPGGEYLYAPVEENKLATLGQLLQYAQDHELEPNGYPFDFMPPEGEMPYIFLSVKVQ